MTSEEIARVRADFAVLGPIAQDVGASLYTRLFVLDGTTRELFKHDLDAQAVHLMEALGKVVDSLDDPETFDAEVRGLATRHVGYGIKKAHFGSVGEALIATLQSGLGDEFTPQARAAWIHAYEALSEAMIAEMGDQLE